MERTSNLVLIIQYILLTGLVLGGLWQIVFGQPLTGHFTFLLLFTLLSIALEEKRLLVWFVVVTVLTHIIEVIGVATGIVFGSYVYGDVLGYALGGVPIIIGVLWSFIVLGLSGFVYVHIPNRWYRATAVGLLAVAFDIVLEIAAINLGFWSWSQTSVPILNYIAWFVIAFFAALALPTRPRNIVSYGVLILFLLICSFVVLL